MPQTHTASLSPKANTEFPRPHVSSRSSSRQRLKDRERDRPPAIEGVYKMEDDGLMQRFLFVEEVCVTISLMMPLNSV